jgi:hypothetical protein
MRGGWFIAELNDQSLCESNTAKQDNEILAGEKIRQEIQKIEYAEEDQIDFLIFKANFIIKIESIRASLSIVENCREESVTNSICVVSAKCYDKDQAEAMISQFFFRDLRITYLYQSSA